MADTSLIFNLVARDRASEVVSGMKDKISTAAAGIGAAVGAAMAKGVTDFINMDAANDKLAAQLGLSEKASERIGKIAGGLYSDAYGDSIEQVNEAVGSVMSSIKGMSNASSKDIEAASTKALDFATTFDVDVTEAVKHVGVLMNTGLAKDSTQAFDLITKAAQKVPASLRGDILEAGNEYGQFFDTLGFDGKEAFSVLVEGSKKGQFGIDKAGDAIKEFTIRSTDMSTSSQDAFKAIGLDANDMANAILAGGDSAKGATDKIINGILGIPDPAKQAEAAIALFGTPLEDLNVKDIPQFLKSLQGGSKAMEGFGGASKRMGDTLNDNASVALTEFKRKVEMKLTEVGGTFVNFAMQNQGLFKPLAIGIGVLATAILAVKAGMMVYTATMTVVRAATVTWTAIQWALNASFWANPLTWIIAGIIALIAIIVLIATKTNFFQTAWKAMTAGVGAAWNWVWGRLKAIGGMIVSFFMNWTLPGLIIKHWDKIKSVTSRVWNAIVNFVKAIPKKIVSFFTNWPLASRVIRHFIKMQVGAKRKALDLLGWIKRYPGRIVRGLGSLGSLLFRSGVNLIKGFIRGIKNMAGNVASAVKGVVQKARNFLPFSPAKEGPFSGKGWTLYSGQAVVEGFAEGVTSRASVAQNAMGDVMGASAAPIVQRQATASPVIQGGGQQGAHVVLELRGDRDLIRLIRRGARVRGGSIEVKEQ